MLSPCEGLCCDLRVSLTFGSYRASGSSSMGVLGVCVTLFKGSWALDMDVVSSRGPFWGSALVSTCRARSCGLCVWSGIGCHSLLY